MRRLDLSPASSLFRLPACEVNPLFRVRMLRVNLDEELNDDLVIECLRAIASEPRSLAAASLVCSRWRSLTTKLLCSLYRSVTLTAGPILDRHGWDQYTRIFEYYHKRVSDDETLALPGASDASRWMNALHNNSLSGFMSGTRSARIAAVVELLGERKQLSGPYLILTPTDRLEDWRVALTSVGESQLCVYEGSPECRLAKRNTFMLGAVRGELRSKVMLCSYSIATRDAMKLRTALAPVWGFKWVVADDGVDALRKGWQAVAPCSQNRKLWELLVADQALTSAFILADERIETYDFDVTCWISGLIPNQYQAGLMGRRMKIHVLPALHQALEQLGLSHAARAAIAKNLLRREMQILLSSNISFRV